MSSWQQGGPSGYNESCLSLSPSAASEGWPRAAGQGCCSLLGSVLSRLRCGPVRVYTYLKSWIIDWATKHSGPVQTAARLPDLWTDRPPICLPGRAGLGTLLLCNSYTTFTEWTPTDRPVALRRLAGDQTPGLQHSHS